MFGALCACSGNRHKPVEKKSTEELLDDLANEEDETIRIAAVRQLGLTRNTKVLENIVLRDYSERVGIAAAAALGDSKDPSAAEALWTAAHDPKRDRAFHSAAAIALAKLGDARAAGTLVQLLHSSGGPESATLVGLGPLAVAALVEALGDPATRDGASRVLILMGGTAVDGLTAALHSSDISGQRLAAASTLAEIDDPRATDALSEALKAPSLELTLAAYRFLIWSGQAGTEAQLTHALNAHGNLAMAEDFLTSGNPALKSAAEDWLRRHNYSVTNQASDLAKVYWGGVDPAVKRLGLYHFDNSLTSTSGTAPSESNGVTFVPGKWGTAVSVGQGGILAYPLKGNLNFQDGTIEMWISPRFDGIDPIYTKYNHPLLVYSSPQGDQFLVAESVLGGFYAGSVVHHQFNGAGGGSISNWKAGSWHHIAFTYSSQPKRQRFYVDGVLIVENHFDMPGPDAGAGSFTVGCDSYRVWTGFVVDELQISDREKRANAIRNSASRKEPFADH
jgi:hypothetical protein